MNVLAHGSRPERWVIPLHFNPYPVFTLAHDESVVALVQCRTVQARETIVAIYSF